MSVGPVVRWPGVVPAAAPQREKACSKLPAPSAGVAGRRRTTTLHVTESPSGTPRNNAVLTGGAPEPLS